MFVGSATWQGVDNHFPHHLAWGFTKTHYDQHGYNVNFSCKDMAWHRADGGDCDDRYHTRYLEFGYVASDAGGPATSGYHVHLTPHLEKREMFLFVICSGHSVVYDGFNRARAAVVDAFHPQHNLLQWQCWGNTQPMRQKDGNYVASDGWVAYLPANDRTGNREPDLPCS